MEDIIVETARPAAATAIERLRNRNKVAGTYLVALDREWAEEMRKVRADMDRLSTFTANADGKRQFKEAEARKAELEAQLADPAVFSSPSRVQELQQQLDPATREVERLYARWQELQNLAAPQSA